MNTPMMMLDIDLHREVGIEHKDELTHFGCKSIALIEFQGSPGANDVTRKATRPCISSSGVEVIQVGLTLRMCTFGVFIHILFSRSNEHRTLVLPMGDRHRERPTAV
jgi:hypothetical protein